MTSRRSVVATPLLASPRVAPVLDRELGGTRHLDGSWTFGVQYIVVKRYNGPDPGTLPFLTALTNGGRRIATFSPNRPGMAEVEQTRIDPSRTIPTRGSTRPERPGPVVEIWHLDPSGS